MTQKVVLVTGGSSGIGLATCKYLKTKGCIVYGTSRKAAHGEIKDGITMLYLDLNLHNTIHNAVSYLLEKEGRIDVLVNNAGLGFAGSVEDASSEEIEHIFRTNVFGVLECCRAVIPSMRKQGGGWIVNISSIAGEFGLPFRGVYCASKSAIDLFSETMRMELMPANIRVSIVQPGDVHTNINNNRIVAERSKQTNSPYYQIFKETYQHIASEVATAKSPDLVAQTIGRIINLDKPRMRYPVASFVQRLSLSVNRVLPKHLFQKILLRRYPVE